MALSVSKGSVEIITVTADFGLLFLPYTSSLRRKQRTHSFNTGRYLQSLKQIPFDNNNSITPNANIFRSMQKMPLPTLLTWTLTRNRRRFKMPTARVKLGNKLISLLYINNRIKILIIIIIII